MRHRMPVRKAGTSARSAAFVALVAVGALILAGAASPSNHEDPDGQPTLTGETLAGFNGIEPEPTPGQCDENGFVYTYSTSGPAGGGDFDSNFAVGPYPGTFEESGTIRVGQNQLPSSPVSNGEFVIGNVLEFHAQFTIYSGDTTITGTKTMTVPNGQFTCANFTEFSASGFRNDAHVRSTRFVARYEATIHAPTGTFRDRGRATVELDHASVHFTPGLPGVPRPSARRFREFFVSDLLVTEPLGPAAVVVTPKTAANPVSTKHEVTATVVNAAGGPVQGVHVEFLINGASGTVEKSCTTDQDGQCSITYVGPTFPGVDTITACADSDNDGQQDAGEPCDEATKEWVLPVSTPGKATGGGQILHAASTGTTFGFTFDANDVVNGLKGECEVLDHAPATAKVNCLNVLAYVQSANEATVYGNATLNGEDHGLFRLHVVDNGESGIGQDVFEFETEHGYVRAGVLTEGDIQVHPLALP